MSPENVDRAGRELAHRFVTTVVMENWRKFGLPDALLAEAMMAQATVLMANAVGPVRTATWLHDAAVRIEAIEAENQPASH